MKKDHSLLKRLSILYVEDDELIRNELTSLLVKFFKNIHTATDGEDGLNIYNTNKDHIDVIISDINMPNLSGIEMVKKIRESNQDIPIIFTTAYSDVDYLSESIKLKIYDYIIKPIDVRALLTSMTLLSNVLYNKELLNEQTKELEKYKFAVDKYNMVIKTNTAMKITSVNELFTSITDYDKDELLGKGFESLKHKDTNKDIYTTMYADVSTNKTWHGTIKQVKKTGEEYVVDAYMMAIVSDAGNVEGSISIQRDITHEVNKKREVQMALMKDKGDIFIKSKEGTAEQTKEILELNEKIETLEKSIEKSNADQNKYIYVIDKLKSDKKKSNEELRYYKRNYVSPDDQSTITLKTNRENSEFKQKINVLTHKIEELNKEIHKKVKQTKITCEIKIDDLEKELNDYRNKLDSIDDGHVLLQKVDYWKIKAKNEAKKVEELEKKVMQHADKPLLQKLFGNN